MFSFFACVSRNHLEQAVRVLLIISRPAVSNHGYETFIPLCIYVIVNDVDIHCFFK
jgi:hypothetical protein